MARKRVIVKGFKGFDKDLKCRGMQYKTGETFEAEAAELCETGLHFCEYPLDCLGYYEPAAGRYCAVEAENPTDETRDDTKRVTRKLTIGAELNFFEMAKAAVSYITERIETEKTETAHEDQSAATNTGDQSAATNTGDQSAATNTGYQSAATNTGYQSAATNTGNQSAATNTGYRSAATNTGTQSAATNTGYRSAATNTGNQSAATNTGYRSAATNTGDQSAATNTGNQSAATNTGYQSAATNTGNQSAATNTGDQSAATNTGDQSAAKAEGKESFAFATGIEGRAAGALGCWIGCAEWEQRDGEWYIKDFRSVRVDGEKIRPDTFYILKGGEFVEACDD